MADKIHLRIKAINLPGAALASWFSASTTSLPFSSASLVPGTPPLRKGTLVRGKPAELAAIAVLAKCIVESLSQVYQVFHKGINYSN